ncbi:class I SAM-dependent methyltransferase [Breoghania sp. L-A4]|uniref:class I SAM-dependent methyltransferase n=1 Tax=Breoghania sp. L-A4 TaxID=2304600 RepID=UPI000E35C62D|nr:class I SAM-dependent methyltransferase [Breoghania sp. L-A4]AXS40434.1 methyltransferase domain-containing protein [Breoghania sp. L-A4]
MPCCRACGAELTHTLIDLGEQPVSNAFLPAGSAAAEPRFPLKVMVCGECLLAQAVHDIPADALFDENYAYFSSYSDSWLAHARAYAQAMTERFGLDATSRVVEVASNDGYLLQNFVAAGIPVLGVEPTANTAKAAIAKGVATHIGFFSKATAELLVARGIRADLMAANNVLAHVPDIVDFASGFAVLLKPQGVATFEFPHLLNLIAECQFDTIYHEHYSYLSLAAVEKIFGFAGLRVFDVEELPTHGGSLRVYACAVDADRETTANVAAMRAREAAAGLDSLAGHAGLGAAAEAARRGFLAFLETARTEGAKVAAYGAAAKGNTFLNYCAVTADDISLVADRSAAKQGKLLPGSRIPVVSPDALREARPDYVVILPWNLREEIASDLAFIRDWGGRFVVAIPGTGIF